MPSEGRKPENATETAPFDGPRVRVAWVRLFGTFLVGPHPLLRRGGVGDFSRGPGRSRVGGRYDWGPGAKIP